MNIGILRMIEEAEAGWTGVLISVTYFPVSVRMCANMYSACVCVCKSGFMLFSGSLMVSACFKSGHLRGED